MAGTGHTGIKLAANAEAQWFAGLVFAGKVTAAEAREAIGVPADVRSVWDGASEWDEELAVMLTEIATFRRLVAEKFERLLAAPVKSTRCAKSIQRSGKREPRLPVLAAVAGVAAETGLQATI